uniref:Uncharacterized protein n=1 Tax=Rhizophora mucronata TaxID=61149 RepID=A0A2P2MUA5_RHIMU
MGVIPTLQTKTTFQFYLLSVSFADKKISSRNKLKGAEYPHLVILVPFLHQVPHVHLSMQSLHVTVCQALGS